MSLSCPKCQAPRTEGDTTCPSCKIIYDKFDAAKYQALLIKREQLRNDIARRAAASAATPEAPSTAAPAAAKAQPQPEQIEPPLNSATPLADPWVHQQGDWTGGKSPAGARIELSAFARKLRAATLYPTFRQLVGVFYALGLVLAALCLLGAFIALFTGSGAAKVGGFLGGLFLALLSAVIAKASKEMSLMLADLSDAAVLIAARMRD